MSPSVERSSGGGGGRVLNRTHNQRRSSEPEVPDGDDRQGLIESLTNIDRERRVHILYTCLLYYCFISVGLCYSIFNPTLVELSEIYGTNLEGISKIFPIRAVGTTLGTLSIGFLTCYFNRQILLFSALILKALTVFLVPQWHSVRTFCVNGFFNGFATATIVVMVNVWLNEIWSQSARQRRLDQRNEDGINGDVENVRDEKINIGNVLMQALHFFFGLGCIFGPLLAEPFLHDTFINRPGFFTNSLVLPFSLCASSAVISSLSLFLAYLVVPYEQLNMSDKKSGEESNSHTAEQTRSLKLLKNCVFVISGVYVMVFLFSEGSYFQFSSSFATQTKLHLNQATTAFLASTLAASFTVARALSILIAIKLTPGTMIFLDLIIVAIGNFLVFFSDTNLPLFTSGLVLLGAGFASVFPSFFPFLEYHKFVVTDKVGSLLTFAGAITEVIAPFVIGLYIDTMPQILVYATFLSLTLSFIVLTGLFSLIKLVRAREKALESPDRLTTIAE